MLKRSIYKKTIDRVYETDLRIMLINIYYSYWIAKKSYCRRIGTDIT